MARIYDFEEIFENKLKDSLYNGTIQIIDLTRQGLNTTMDIISFELNSIVYETPSINDCETYSKLLEYFTRYCELSAEVTHFIKNHHDKNGGN